MFSEINQRPIYCLMVTSDARKKFIPIGIKNFMMQSMKKKYLVIINNSDDESKTKLAKNISGNNIFEFHIPKKENNFSLGDLRNIALELVPMGALWTTWDDDDWRGPDYLYKLNSIMESQQADIVFLKNRLEYNLNNGFSYRSEFQQAKMPFFLAKKITGFQYLNRDSLEDVNVAADYKRRGKKIYLWNNDPKLYLRNIHNTNSSVYVDNDKRRVLNYATTSHYHEFDVTKEEQKYIQYIISEYFQGISLEFNMKP